MFLVNCAIFETKYGFATALPNQFMQNVLSRRTLGSVKMEIYHLITACMTIFALLFFLHNVFLCARTFLQGVMVEKKCIFIYCKVHKFVEFPGKVR